LDGATTGAWIGGCAGAATVRGASSSAEYSRTSRPLPQSTSTRKVTSGWRTGTLLVTRITGRPRSSRATLKSRSAAAPVGGSSPIRAKVSGEASRAWSCSSSAGSLEMMGISASKGWSIFDFTWICPSPSAAAGPAAMARATANAMRCSFIRDLPLAGPLGTGPAGL
jgi:hypothetical protein